MGERVRTGAKVAVGFNGEVYHVVEGTPVAEVLGRIYLQEHEVVGATLNNHLVSLETPVDGDSLVRAVTPESREGQEILRRTASHVLHLLFRTRFPQFSFVIGQSLLGGYFYEVDGAPDLEAMARELTAGLEELAAQDLPIKRLRVSVEALDRWLPDPFGCKAKLLKAWALPVVPLVSLDGFVDIQHGPYASSTGCVRGSKVVAYPPGLVLQFPNAAVPPRKESVLFRTYRETREWNQLVGVATVGDLNEAILEDRLDQVVRIAEALQEKKIASVADEVVSRRDRVICVAGPSSSGKTTFVKRLAVQLQVNGVEPVLVSLDDYYRPRSETPRDELGEYDFEALEALNLEQLEQDLAALAEGREVRMPRFDFVRGVPTPQEGWRRLMLKPGQVVLLEGIHALNPRIAQGHYRIFVSALTQLVLDEHNRILTSEGRLMRRLVRDRRYRGTSAADTIARWPSVRRGEEEHIFPFQEEADVMFNSTLLYETAVLKPFAWRYLLEVPREHPSRVRAYEMIKFLEWFVPAAPEVVPANSVIREFIGGSGFRS